MASSDDVIELKHGRAVDTTCQVRKFGATVTSWVVDGVENIFVSSKSVMDGTKAIRGGIPICFPSFGAWKMGPQHGFARDSNRWKVAADPKVDSESGDVTVTLSLEDDEDTRKLWDHKFLFLFHVTLRSKELVMDVDIKNNGAGDMDFTFALHTYFKVPDVTGCKVTNLSGLTYVDKTQEGKEHVEQGEEVKIQGFTDRVYLSSPDHCLLEGLHGGRGIKLSKVNIVDTVVWNPWAENAAKMADFGDEEYKNMICVEAVQHSKQAMVAAGEHWKATHTLAVKE